MNEKVKETFLAVDKLARQDFGYGDHMVTVSFVAPPSGGGGAEAMPDPDYARGRIMYDPSLFTNPRHTPLDLVLYAYHENAHFVLAQLQQQFEILLNHTVSMKSYGDMAVAMSEPVLERTVESIGRAVLNLRLQVGAREIDKFIATLERNRR